MNCTRVTPSGFNTFLLRVDGAQGGDVRGVVDGVALNAPLEFTSFANLVLQLEDALDGFDSLPAGQAPCIRKIPADFEPSVELEILFRQNHSWQGKVTLLGQQKEAAFRSVLELLIFMVTALATPTKKEE